MEGTCIGVYTEGLYKSIVGRAGAFSAQFDPELLERFRSFCGGRGEKYTKVLESLAAYYLETEGEVLNGVADASSASQQTESAEKSTIQELVKRLDNLEEANEYLEVTLNQMLKRMDNFESK